MWNTQPNQKERTEMSNYNWCHNEKCHTYHTTDRIRGSKGNKVLRTRKIKVLEELPYYYQGWENHFCKVTCFFDYMKIHWQEIVRIAPRREALETPIKDPYKETIQSNWGNHSWTKTRIEVDNSNG